jgi:Pro-kumamolisin, activation domain/Bacterial Ig-like domain (group 3)
MGTPLPRFSCLVVFFCFLAAVGFGQQVSPTPLITKPVVESELTTLKGNTHPLAQPRFDIGAAPPDLPMNRMLLVLKRSPEQEHSLRTLLDNQQDKASAHYHKWLTPDQFGAAFGPADQDVQIVTGWLQTHGFQVNRISRGRTVIEFSGTEAQVEEALHTSIHKYAVNGEEHWANAADPQIPAALAPVVAGVQALNNFPATRYSQVAGVVSRDKSTGQVTSETPLFTLPSNGCGVQRNDCFGVGPYDFATIYNVAPAWNASPAVDGTGQTIAIVGETDINPQDVFDFRNFFGLPVYAQPGGPTLNVIHNGPAPGILNDGEETEADLDVEWSGAVAKGASVDFVVSQTTETTLGIHLSALYIVDNNLAAVMSESYGTCELFLGSGGNQFFSSLWQQAAAQGITVMISSGDGGSAGCDNFDVRGPATTGLQVSGYASTPYNVAVGGTDFSDLTNASSYWSLTNNSTTHASALSYIPETTWDDNCTNPVFGTLLGFSTNAEANCNNGRLINAGFVNIVSGSGGRSSCTSSDGQNPASCAGGYPKPSWQIAPGVPADRVRDLPDISLFAASGSPSGSFYLVCEADAVNPAFTSCNPNDLSTQFLGIGGTSASSPAFAGIMALVNQTQSKQGNANFVLYKLAQQHPSTFHDVTTGTIAVPCQTGSPNCTTSHPGDQFGILSGYNAGAGYDLATGIGSVDVNSLLQNWTSAQFTATTTTLRLDPTSSLTHGQAVTVTGTVAPSSGSGVPTGDVSLITSTGLGVDGFTLANGAISGSTNLLPGGAYTVTAHYAGDTTFGGSDSGPVNITVGKENSSMQIELITFDWNGNLISSNAPTAVYGSPYILRMNVLDTAGAACQLNPLGAFGCPTGHVTLTDNSSALDGGTFALNSLGYTEDQLVQFTGGSNAVKATYAGDNSFNASSANTTYSITPAPTTVGNTFWNASEALGQLEATVYVDSHSTGVVPGGTFTFYVNGTAVPGSVTYNPYPSSPSNPNVTLQADFVSTASPFPTPGTYTLSAAYNGDRNYQPLSFPGSSVTLKFPPSTVYVQSSSYSIAAGASVTLSATVIGYSTTISPTGTISFNSSFGQISGPVTYTTINDPNTGNLDLKATISVAPTFTDYYGAQYTGDSNFGSGQGSAQVAVAGTDFTLLIQQSTVTLSAGSYTQIPMLVGLQSGAAPVTFSATPCTGLPAETTCTFENGATSVSYTTSSLVNISTTGPHAIASEHQRARDGFVLAFLLTPLLAIISAGDFRRRFRSLGLGIVGSILLLGLGCGGGSSGGGGGGGGKIDPGTPPGSYTITVTATSGSGSTAISHTTTFTLVVQ